MVRRYRRSAPRDKYSVENTCCITPPISDWSRIEGDESTQASNQFKTVIVASNGIEGMRKVKHLTLSFSLPSDNKLFFALVYVPSGYEANTLNIPTLGSAVSLYDPNQYVMASGVLDFSGGPCRIRTPLSRNLNSGDSIQLVVASPVLETPNDNTLSINCQYAITLQ